MRDEKLNEIIDALQDCCFDELNEYNYYDDVIWYFKQKYKKPFSYEHGASKLVLIFENDFVIKIPFVGYCGDGEYYDEDTDSYYGDDFYEFSGALSEDSHWNYCEVELEKYNHAVDYELDGFFAKIEKICCVNGHPIYIQEYAEVFENSISSHTDEEKESTRALCDGWKNVANRLNINWLTDAITYFGKNYIFEFFNFINNEKITDLHCGNLGYIGNRPVIIDYSGWND